MKTTMKIQEFLNNYEGFKKLTQKFIAESIKVNVLTIKRNMTTEQKEQMKIYNLKLKIDPNKNPKYFFTSWNRGYEGYFVKFVFNKPYGQIKKLLKNEGILTIYNELFYSLEYGNTKGPKILKYKEFEFKHSCIIGDSSTNSFYFCYDLIEKSKKV